MTRTSILAGVAILACFAAFSSSALAAPANDNFLNAQLIGPALPVAVPASNVGATAEAGEPSLGGNAAVSTVWFKWTAPASAVTVVDLCGSGFTGSSSPFETFAVRTGVTLGTLVPVVEMAGECRTRFAAVAGQEYKLQVDYRNVEGSFTFRLRQLAPPANDMFATPTVIGPGLPVSLNTTNVDSTWQAGEPAGLGGSSNSRSVWYSWSPSATGRVRLDFCTYTSVVGPGNKNIGVYTGNTLGTLAPVISSTANCSLDFPVIAGATYRIAFSGYLVGEGNFVLKLKSAPPPANDNFADAIAVGPGLPLLVQGENEFATVETGEPSHSGIGDPDHSAWYTWTPATNMRVRIKACSRTFEARLGVYTGAAVNALTPVGEMPPYAPHCGIILNAVAGTTYRIAAATGPVDGGSGKFELDIHGLKVPANDNFADARILGADLPAQLDGSTVDATNESGEPAHQLGGSGSQTPSVWFRWTARTSDAIIFSACSRTEPTRLAIYSGTVLNDLTPLAGADTGCRDGTNGGRLALAPDPGKTYMIAVAAVERDFESAFTLSAAGPAGIKPPVIKPPVIKPPVKFNLKKAIKKCKRLKSKQKRKSCIKRAKKKAAIIKCKKITKAGKRSKCIAKARKKFR